MCVPDVFRSGVSDCKLSQRWSDVVVEEDGVGLELVGDFDVDSDGGVERCRKVHVVVLSEGWNVKLIVCHHTKSVRCEFA